MRNSTTQRLLWIVNHETLMAAEVPLPPAIYERRDDSRTPLEDDPATLEGGNVLLRRV